MDDLCKECNILPAEWPGRTKDEEICQECWEKHCAESFWDFHPLTPAVKKFLNVHEVDIFEGKRWPDQ